MACKMRCPACSKMLKIKDDHGKDASGEYIVINTGTDRYIKCLECEYSDNVRIWSDFEMQELMNTTCKDVNTPKCPECGNNTTNEQRLCKGACASERYHGTSDENFPIGVEYCDCCDHCRDKCHDSFLEEYGL